MANMSDSQNFVDNKGDQGVIADTGEAAIVDLLLEIPLSITIHDLAKLLDVEPVEIIKHLMRAGYMLTINDVIEYDIAAGVAQLYGHNAQKRVKRENGGGSQISPSGDDAEENLEIRSPIVAILGHVDHGKTTLLDRIRSSNVVDNEAGGITQHIGAYQVKSNGTQITFLDTPGHEAFTAMRARGAHATDIAVLVVAADDGIMPQTLEAIDHVKAADVPMVVAINKVDRPEADPERVKRQLAENDLLVEEWGGEIIAVSLSALNGDGVQELMDNILVVAEVGELRANPNRLAKGIVVEASIDKSKGPLVTVLNQTGTLRVGDSIVVGRIYGRIKAMINDKGKRVKSVGPSGPAEILGISGLPEAGDIFEVVPNDRAARQISETRTREAEAQRGFGTRVTLEDVHARIETGEIKTLNLIVKTDVQGSVEAVRTSLEFLTNEQARVNLLRVATGSITESDVLLAEASQAVLLGFNSQPDTGARALSSQRSIPVRHYDVIYNLIDDVEKALEGLLEAPSRDVVEGYGTVRAVFNVGRRAQAAGIYVNEGRISRGAEIHVRRGSKELFIGSISTLKHFKDDVREIQTAVEGGIVLDGFNDYSEGDILEAHLIE